MKTKVKEILAIKGHNVWALSPQSTVYDAVEMMAKKKKAGANKSQLIRDYLTEHPDAQNKDVAKALSKQGVKSQDVANLKTRIKASAAKTPKKSAKKKKSRRKASPQTVELSSVEAAADFISTVGGIHKAKQALSATEEIAKKLQ